MNEDLLRDVNKAISTNLRDRLALEHRFGRGKNRPKVSHGQFTLLTLLDELGESTMGALAKEMGLSLGGLTGLVDRVIQMGLVERFRIPQDRRVVKVTLTDGGREALAKIMDVDREFLGRVMGRFTAEERGTFLKIYGSIVEELQAGDGTDPPKFD